MPLTTWPQVPWLDEDDPLEHHSGDRTGWTVTNAAEAMPGVLSPLGASFWIPTCEIGLRTAFCDLGVLPKREVRIPQAADDRLSAVFAGRYAANLDTLRRMADLTPGTSGEAMERQLFGEAREGIPKTPGARRLPFVLAKGPVAVKQLPARLRAASADVHAWWRAAVTEDLAATPGLPKQRLAEAMSGVAFALRTHMAAAMIGPGLFDKVRELAESAGRPGLELALVSGFGDLEEATLVVHLRAVAAGEESLDSFLEVYGFHGPDAGEISSRSWRDDSAPLERMVETYQSLAASDSGAASQEAAVEAETELLAALPRTRRAGARLLLRMARTYNPLREVGKANFLKGIDAGRHAARAYGAELVSNGVLDDAEDVFMLSVRDLLHELPDDPKAVVRARRAQRERLLGFQLPDRWTGNPTPVPIGAARDLEVTEVTGLAASPGTVEGLARVVTRAADSDAVREGEILVCPITDPSWAAALGIVAALVVDVGGPMSHGAIIAREFGIPCVIGTSDGTTQLRTGDVVRVDGDAGTVQIISRETGRTTRHGEELSVRESSDGMVPGRLG